MQPFSTAPLTDHLHEATLQEKRGVSQFVQEMLIQRHGEERLRLLLDNHQWHTVPGGPAGLAVRHIERHPQDTTAPTCGDALPHLSVFAVQPGMTGTFITQYHARLSCISGSFYANNTLVTSHDRTLNEYHSLPNMEVSMEVIEMSYVMVKYFPSFEGVSESEMGPTLNELAQRHAEGKNWFTIYSDGQPVAGE
jgi:hypothetical protein